MKQSRMDLDEAFRMAKVSPRELADVKEQEELVVIYEDDGLRYAVVNSAIAGTTHFSINPNVVIELGIDIIRIYVPVEHTTTD